MDENTSKAYADDGAVDALVEGGAGTSLFVINLCASIAPVDTSSRNIPGLENYRIYQVARVEDGRTRHRLRLGFFTTESHAQSVLTMVRQQYPTAFTSCLADEDRKFARGFLPAGAQRRANISVVPAAPPAAARATSAAPAPAVQPQAPAAKAQPAAKPAPVASPETKPAAALKQAAAQAVNVPPAAKPAVAQPAAAKAPAKPAEEIIELTWEPEPAAASTAAAANAAAAPAQPALSSDAGLDDFTWEPPAAASRALAEHSTSDTAKHPALKPTATARSAKAAAPSTSDTAKHPALTLQTGSHAAYKPAAPAAATDAAASMRVRVPDLTFSEPPVAATSAAPPSSEPFHVGKGVDIGDLDIKLDAEPSPSAAPPASVGASDRPSAAASKSAMASSQAAASKPAAGAKQAGAAKPTTPATQAAKPAPAASTPAKPSSPVTPATSSAAGSAAGKAAVPGTSTNPLADLPDLDSTQTIRALTSAELNDDAQEKWFAIQLAASEQPVNLDTMPRLDIFEAYRLYSVAIAGSGKIVHSLRLGFFKEAVSAEAVSGYLKTFFGSPSVLRVSLAEHARFKDPVAKKSAPKHEAKVVDLNDARASRPVVPTVTMEVAPPRVDPSATGSFKPNATGTFKANATGSFKPNATGSFKAGATGTHRTLTPTRAAGKTSASGKHKALTPKRSLSDELLEEAREVELSESGIRKLPKNDSLLSRLVGKLTK